MTGTGRIDRRALLAAPLVAATLHGAATAAVASPPLANGIALWPGHPPDGGTTPPVSDYRRMGSATHPDGQLRGVAMPMLHRFRPTRPNGAALLVLPGGGYEFLAVTREGLDVAQRFAGMGYSVYVLTYRLPAEGWRHAADVPLQDAQRAMRMIRSRARSDAVDPAQVGVLGFSAGGHLAATLATASDEQVYTPIDRTDALSARPDFVGLLYPVTTLRAPDTHGGSRDHLIGRDPTPDNVDRRSPVLHVTGATPPTFLVHALDDDVVPPRNGIDWLLACRTNRVPVEAYFPERGGHGFGVAPAPANPAGLWPALFANWLDTAAHR